MFICLVFLSSSLSKFYIFLCFFVINPFLEDIFLGGLFCLYCLPFPLLINVCLFLWNKLSQHPLFETHVAFLFGCFFFLWLFLFLFSWCMFLPFYFYVDFVLGMFFLCYWFVFALFLVLLSESFRLCKKCFPAILVCFELSWLKGI